MSMAVAGSNLKADYRERGSLAELRPRIWQEDWQEKPASAAAPLLALAPLLPGLRGDLPGNTLHAEICRAILASRERGSSSTEVPHPDININDPTAGTILHWAAAQGLRDVCMAIISCPAFRAVNTKRQSDGSTALHVAAAQGLGRAVEAILAHDDFTGACEVDHDGFTALHGAAARGHDSCVRALLASVHFGAAAGVIGRFDAARPVGHWTSEAAKLCDVGTALHAAAAAGHASVCKAILLLAPAGSANADATNRLGATALHMAAQGRHAGACRELLTTKLPSGAFAFSAVNVRDARGFTALHWAAQQASGDICHAILERDDFVDVGAKDLKGRTALNIAKDARLHEVCRLILARAGTEVLPGL
eukprot:gnl/TRDRNA2_/TRDRNA2_39362_c0_seq1.p1 gnl/TRDRNA2_/TRDRNA2_39362_c0~~gnl/TRDRNA2_/TRDRNA2_39362_c0_seq1.p1  ORF type:complete len:372 (-),score=68.09 gnl/TRDRNA2_/TRDRNA2_39362_c0_seq1:66-1160(-)